MQLPAPKQEASSELVEISNEAKEASRFDSSEVIYPPPDLRVIIDKTASFVARVGPRFEAKIREQERGNPKFAFLNEGDPYYAYYRVQSQAAKQGGGGNAPMTAGSAAEEVQAAIQADQSTTQIDTSVPEEPPAHEFSIEFPGVPAVDLDVVKLTALFTARKGPSFASGLAAREARSYQFEFLKPAHPLFSYFNLLVEQYRRVMHPSAQLLNEVQLASHHQGQAPQGPGRGGPRMHILQRIQQRAKWAKWHADREREMAQEEKRMKGLFDEIDWQDFIVVGVVELTDADERAELPAARSRRELKNLAIAQQRMAAMNQETPAGQWEKGAYEAAASQIHTASQPTNNKQSSTEAPERQSSPSARPAAVDTQQLTHAGNQPPTQAAPARSSIQVSTPQGPIKIRHDYQRETRTGKAAAQTTVCPVCGETVPIATMGEHVRVELMNPKFREERQKLEQRKEEQASLAQGADPSRFLREFAGARTDLFGHQSDEVARQKREAQAQQLAREKVKHVWDGHLNSASSTQEAKQRTAHVDQAIAQLHPTEPSAPTAGPERPTVPQKRANEADPSGKTTVPKTQPQYIPRKEDGSLYSESEWLSMYPYPVMVQVKLPNSPQTSAKCNGRMLRLGSMPLSTTIGTIRDRVLIGPLERTVGASKLKLWIAGKPATLRQTLAYWNFANGDTIEMSLSK
ncbi:SF3a splicing factor complex subunit [Malassezia psittaci]|uniref:SF3a splicing factor complex subunit n=1 Tax=Malassezia psittaci TaxID=1821823 RepID=A0AAF0JG41_9BASI|nr:SF3a splicing factor complex subunit [Malassezia psittaci]